MSSSNYTSLNISHRNTMKTSWRREADKKNVGKGKIIFQSKQENNWIKSSNKWIGSISNEIIPDDIFLFISSGKKKTKWIYQQNKMRNWSGVCLPELLSISSSSTVRYKENHFHFFPSAACCVQAREVLCKEVMEE